VEVGGGNSLLKLPLAKDSLVSTCAMILL